MKKNLAFKTTNTHVYILCACALTGGARAKQATDLNSGDNFLSG